MSKLILPFLFLLFFASNCFGERCFKAAVFERINDPVSKNLVLALIKRVVEDAKVNGAAILVLPENSVIMKTDDRNLDHKAAEVIPDANENFNPCENKNVSGLITNTISCLAKENKIYIVANLFEKKDCSPMLEKDCFTHYYLFNTNVVFDDNGVIIAKYNKYHLFDEKSMDFPTKQQFVYFDTPFGRLGTFICFDMIFKQPGIDLVRKYKIDTMLFTTHWFDEAPFLLAHQFQQAWAIKNKVNFLAANINDLSNGCVGSGIYSGKKGAINYHYDQTTTQSKLMIANLPINPNQDENCQPDNKIITYGKFSGYYVALQLPLNDFNYRKLNSQTDSFELCQKSTCCKLTYEFENNLSSDTYYLIVHGGKRKGKYQYYQQMCALVKYDEQAATYSSTGGEKFKYLRLDSSFNTEFIYPSVLGNHWKLVPVSHWTFTEDSKTIMLTNSAEEITIFALYGRLYDMDSKYP